MTCGSGEAIVAAAIAARAVIDIQIADMLSDAAKEATYAQLDIAQQIQDRANALHDVWQNSYLPCELGLLDEICSEPEEVANTFVHEQRAVASTTKQFSVARQQMEYCIPAACVGARYEGNYMLTKEQARSESWHAQIAKRTEIARVDLVNAQRLNNRIAITKSGRNGVLDTAGAGAGAAAIYGELAAQSAAAFNSAAKVAGRVLQGVSSLVIDGGARALGSAVDKTGIGESQSAQQQSYIREDLRSSNMDPLDAWRRFGYDNEPVANTQTTVQSAEAVNSPSIYYPDP